jgi:leucyl aminopeptidase
MKLIKRKQAPKEGNRIFITNQFDKIKKHISPEEVKFFSKQLKDNELQYTKNINGFTFVYLFKGQKTEVLRKTAHKVHGYLKDEKEATLICENTEYSEAFLEGFLLSNYQFLPFLKEADKKRFKLEKLNIFSEISSSKIKEINHLIQSVFWARDRVNEPVSHLNAEQLAKAIKKLGKAHNFKVEVMHKAKIETLKMGGLLAVNKGSEEPPTFTIAEYKPKGHKNKKPIVLVGKGVVYDTGGLSLKPHNYMTTMKSDMAGAATIVATLDALAQNEIPLHVIALIPATDNRPGKTAYAPDDIVTMYDGTTVEILNTDAEGRMILADALAFANKYKPELVIDAATLTGSAVRALGTKTSISMGNAKDKYFKALYESGQRTYDRVFRLPFWEEYGEEMKSDVADLKNLGSINAGMITAGKFLENFVKYPYIHLDIAGPAFLETADGYNGKGGTGAGVRLLYDFLKGLASSK